MSAVIEALKRRPNLFDVLSEEELVGLAGRCSVARYEAGSSIFAEGDDARYIGIITSGKIEVRKEASNGGRPMLIAVLGPGSPIGEFSVLDGHRRTAGAFAVEDAELVILSRDSLEAFAEECPQGGVKLYRAIGQVLVVRLKRAMERVSILS